MKVVNRANKNPINTTLENISSEIFFNNALG
jgi:hypothetical protein